MSGSRFIGFGELPGYKFYKVGCYPGIVPEESERVKDDICEVDSVENMDYAKQPWKGR